MGGGTGTGGSQYTAMTLDQPWGASDEQVRIFPPCQIKDSLHRGDPVVIFVKNNSKPWKRKRVGWFDYFPTNGFVAWDDKNQEYAWHEVGTIDVPKAHNPTLFKPIIRGESEAVGETPPRRFREVPGSARKRRRFTDWWASKSSANRTPDFLRSPADVDPTPPVETYSLSGRSPGVTGGG